MIAVIFEFRPRPEPRFAQDRGRGHIVADDRLRVAGPIRGDGTTEHARAPADSRARHG